MTTSSSGSTQCSNFKPAAGHSGRLWLADAVPVNHCGDTALPRALCQVVTHNSVLRAVLVAKHTKAREGNVYEHQAGLWSLCVALVCLYHSFTSVGSIASKKVGE